jgi:hypothetical protein
MSDSDSRQSTNESFSLCRQDEKVRVTCEAPKYKEA